MKIEVRVCDVCKDPTLQVATYTVSVGDKTGTTDRCGPHGAELKAIAEGTPPPRPRPRRRGSRVASMDEVEAARVPNER
ncbi:hypothetical protein [Micromonospora sp. WMMD736]|uniref:hypothetical protein n=1 Tax=Micromonospora sp. WMMD736 TaxID=3404112 RepID=UPI003B95E560